MDTITYASVAALPMSIAQYRKHKVAPEPEFTPIVMFWIRRIQAVGCSVF